MNNKNITIHNNSLNNIEKSYGNDISRNIKVDYIYRFLSCFDITSAIWVLYLGYKGMSLTQIGILESIFHITGFISEIPTGAMADLIGRKRIIVLGRFTALISAVIMLFHVSGYIAENISMEIAFVVVGIINLIIVAVSGVYLKRSNSKEVTCESKEFEVEK